MGTSSFGIIAFCFLIADNPRNRHAPLILEIIIEAFKYVIKTFQQHSSSA